MKSIIAAGFLLGCAQGAIAGPYANIENKASFLGDEFSGAKTEVHAGYDFENGFKVQGGPAFLSPDGAAGRTEYSGKVKYSTDLGERLKAYGEVSFITEDKDFQFEELNFGTKVGLTYSF